MELIRVNRLLPQALEEADQQLQKERTELERLLTFQVSDPAADSDEGEGKSEEERLFQVQRDFRMASIVQDALYKREQVISFLAER